MILYEAMQKRKVFLDALTDGLEMFKLKTAINMFPDLLKCLFVASDTCLRSSHVIGMLEFPRTMDGDEERVAEYLKNCLNNFGEKGSPFSLKL